jgi:uncharacterized membrane protein
MLYAVLKTLHLLAIIVWVGGMVFVHYFLRPALSPLSPPERLRLMHDVLGRFYRAVLVASWATLLSGAWMFAHVARQIAASGGHVQMPLAWTLMAALGTLMVAIFMYIRFVPYRQLTRCVAAADWPACAAALARIRLWVGINLGLGISVLLVTLLSSRA